MYSYRTALGSLTLIVALATSSRAQAPLQTSPLDRSNLDTSVAACQDFYEFANGGWLKHDTIPAAYSSSGVTRDMSERKEEGMPEGGDAVMAAMRYMPRAAQHRVQVLRRLSSAGS